MNAKSSGLFRASLRFLGSVKLAMLLLAVVIVATIAGTLIESRFDTVVAQAYVYDAPWFIAWLLLLSVNLIGAVLLRYPWKPHQIGFIVMHAGMVVILVGAIIGRIWGIEGNMTLFAGSAPQNFLVVNDTVLQVQAGEEPEAKSYSVKLNLRPPTREQPARFKHHDLDVAVLGHAEQMGAISRIEPGGSHGAPALRLVLTSATARQSIDTWLLQDHPQRGLRNVGPNVVRFSTQPGAAEMVDNSVSREIHFAFSQMDGMHMARGIIGARSGAVAAYRFSPGAAADDLGRMEIQLGGRKFEFAVKESLDRILPLEDTPWTLSGLRYFPDFRMDGKNPSTASDQPNNPAIAFELLGPPIAASVAAGACCGEKPSSSSPNQAQCDHKDGECEHSKNSPNPPGKELAGAPANPGHQHGAPPASELVIRYTDGKLRFEGRSASGEASGEIAVGAEFSPGWGDWKFRVEEFLEKAVVREALVPLPEPGAKPIGASGLLVRVRKGGDTIERWLQMGTTTFVPLGHERLHLGFGYRLYPLSFNVALERFEVEFNEGTQTPASFKSHVKFSDPASGRTLARAVWMNNPANFPHFPGVGLLGTSYKFSQSSWNPGDLSQTTLQVIRDPGWSLKWIGSLLFCGGLLMMFYLKPYPRWAKPKPGAALGGRSALSPSDRERKNTRADGKNQVPDKVGDEVHGEVRSLAPSDGERAGERGTTKLSPVVSK